MRKPIFSLLPLTAALTLLFGSSAMATLRRVILFQPSSGAALSLYLPTTGETISLDGTENMANAIVADVDADGRENDIVYSGPSGGIRWYSIPADANWHAENDHAVSNTNGACVPLAVLCTGTNGTGRRVIYRFTPTGIAYSIAPSGADRRTLVRMDRAYAVDATAKGYKGELLWSVSGSNMRFRTGPTGTDKIAPRADWVPIGGGRIVPNQLGMTMAFLATKDVTPRVYVCNRDWGFTRVDGTTWSWATNAGSLVTGDVDGDGLDELVYEASSSDPLRWYSAPNSGSAWSSNGAVTVDAVKCGWNLRGVGYVDITVSGTTPPPGPPPPTPTPVQVTKISELGGIADGTLVTVDPKPRTKLVRELDASLKAVTTGYFIEEPDRSAGIRVAGTTSAAEGQSVAVTGTLTTNKGERVIMASGQVVGQQGTAVAPLQTTVSALKTAAAMTGLLITASGAIPTTGNGTGWFTLNDPSNPTSIKVYCADSSYSMGNVTVAGCVGAEKDASNVTIPVLRVEKSADVTPITSPPPPPPSNAKFTMWTEGPMKKVFKTDTSAAATSSTIKAARNEHEVLQLALRSTTNALQSVTVAPTDLVGPGGGRIPVSSMAVYIPGYVYLSSLGKYYPDPLPPYRGPFNVALNETQPIWIDIYVPKTASPGDYAGTVVVSTSNGGSVTYPYTLHVYNFALPDDWKCQTAFYLSFGDIAPQEHVTSGSSQHYTLGRAYYDFMLKRGVSATNFPDDIRSNVLSSSADPYFRDVRMSANAVPYSSNSSTQASILNKYSSFGILGKGYFYPVDEPGTMDMIDQIRSVADYEHSINPGAQIMAPFADDPTDSSKPAWSSGASYAVNTIVKHAENHGRYYKSYLYRCKVAHTASSATEPNKGSNWKTYWSKETGVSTLVGYCDIFCPIIDFYDEWAPALEARRQAGDKIWTYICLDPGGPRPNYHTERLPIETRIITWLNYNCGATGLLYWRVNDWKNTSPDPYQDPVCAYGLYGEGVLLYPGYPVGVSGPVSSIRFEILRESLEDYQYLWLLEQKLGRNAVLGYVDQLVTNWETYTKDINLLDSVRDQIARQIEN